MHWFSWLVIAFALFKLIEVAGERAVQTAVYWMALAKQKAACEKRHAKPAPTDPTRHSGCGENEQYDRDDLQ